MCEKMQCAPPKKCAVSRKKQIQPTKKIWSLSKKEIQPTKKSGACQKNKSNPPKNLEFVKKKNKSNSRKKMELLKKQVEAAKHCLHITNKFESAKTIAGACYKKKQRFAKHICHYFKSCTMVQPVMLAYIYDRHFHCHLHYILHCIFIYTIIFVAVVAQALSFCPAVAAVFDRFNRWRIVAPAGTARKLHRLEQTSNGSSS